MPPNLGIRFFCGANVILFVIGLQSASANEPFRDTIGFPLSYAIVGNLPDFETDLKKADESNVFYHRKLDDSYDTDVVFVFLEGWHTVKGIPLAHLFGDLIEKVQSLDEHSNSYFTLMTLNTDNGLRPVLFTFWNIDGSTNSNGKCVAKTAIALAGQGIEGLEKLGGCAPNNP